jgi:PEP-CTERM motif
MYWQSGIRDCIIDGGGTAFETVGQSGVQVLASVGVPEPASWALMIAGFGLVGGAMRRRVVKISYA